MTKVHTVKPMIFPVVIYGGESWTAKKAEHQRIDAFKLWCWRRLLRVPLGSKEIKPVNPKGNQPWIFTERTDAEAEAPILWPPDAKSQLIGKDPNAGKDWRQEKRAAEDEMVGWHPWLNGQESEQTPGDCEGQGSLACCSTWSGKEPDRTWRLKSNTLHMLLIGETLIPFSERRGRMVLIPKWAPYLSSMRCLLNIHSRHNAGHTASLSPAFPRPNTWLLNLRHYCDYIGLAKIMGVERW